MVRLVLTLLIALVAIGASTEIGRARAGQPLPVEEAFALSVEPAPDGGTRFAFDVADGYYLYRDRITARTATGAAIPLETSAGTPKDDPYFGRMEVYHDRGAATIEAATLARLPAGARIELTYQGCQAGGICYRPQTEAFTLASLTRKRSAGDEAERLLGSILPGKGDDPPGSAGGGWSFADDNTTAPASIPEKGPIQEKTPAADSAEASPGARTTADAGRMPSGTGIVPDDTAGDLVGDLLARGGFPLLVGAFLILGLGLAFTPCVFPMYPILAGQLGRTGGTSHWTKGLVHSGAYVGAMALAFAGLGVVAAWSGRNLQIVLQSPIAIGAVAAIFLALALSMFGFFSLRLPNRFVNVISRRMPQADGGLASSAGLGLLSTLIVGPCVTAPLAGALLYIAGTGNVALGAAALFALGLGQGIPLVLFGTLGSRFLPRAGGWMETVNRVFGVLFLALAIWMADRLLPGWIALGLWAVLALGVGVALGALDGARAGDRGVAGRCAQIAGLVALLYGGLLFTGSVAGGDDPMRPLAPLTAGAVSDRTAAGDLAFTTVGAPGEVASAIEAGDRPTLLYFTADWCVSCDVIERRVFDNPEVRAALAGYRLLEADVTNASEGGDALMDELAVVGPPTMLFLDAQGAEAPSTRAVGELSAEDFLVRARRARMETRAGRS